ncbi:MAG: VWA domain-containing protein [Acidobacteria bacterium]|nr:VWA domain-containing protein [Acidobacteriota bacterium]
MMTRRTLLSLLGTSPLVMGQQKPPAKVDEDLPVIKVDVDLVNVLFSVRDKKNGLVATCRKEDFTVIEEGKQQTIKVFAREIDLPLTIGLLVDVSGSQERLIPEEKAAAGQFFQQVLRKKDMAFLISFGAEAELLQDLTGSPKLLREGLNQLRLNSGVGGLHPGTIPNAKQKGTIMYDAVALAATEKLKSEVGRKAIVLITDGVDVGSTYTRQQAVEAAHKADVIIYSVYFVDYGGYGRGGKGGFGGGGGGDLKKMAEETGGRFFSVGRNQSLADIFTQIQEEMRSQYVIGYSSTNEIRDGAFRKLEIRLADKNLKAQTRKGYYASKR